MNRKDYIKKTNKNLLICWTIIVFVLIISYILEIVKGLRTIDYVIVFSVITISPLIITFIVNLMTNGCNEKIKYVAAIGYCFFYTFALFTSQCSLSFVYIIPMMSALIVYTDKKLIEYTYGYVFILNLLKVFLIILNNKCTPNEITFYEIQIACIILSAVFLIKTMEIIVEGNNKLFELSEDILKDNLTESYNRKFFSNNIEKLFERGEDKNGLNLAFIDIDNFKQFNTNFGHDYGDKVLKLLCYTIQSEINLMKETYLIRMGGDEFVIINNGLFVKDFEKKLISLCNRIGNMKLEDNNIINISIGLANSKVNNCVDYLELYKKADENLYIAKNTGKNKVVFFN